MHAGSFLRERRIILDSGLKNSELRRVLLHELFHFAWVRLSNRRRASWVDLVGCELRRNAGGELGWSAEWRKADLPLRGERFHRDYLCESFCDTGAWRYSGLRKHPEFTLAAHWRDARRTWFDQTFPDHRVNL